MFNRQPIQTEGGPGPARLVSRLSGGKAGARTISLSLSAVPFVPNKIPTRYIYLFDIMPKEVIISLVICA